MSKTNLLSVASSGQQWVNPMLSVKAQQDTKIRHISPPIKNKTKADKLAMFDKFRRLINMSECEVFVEFANQAAKCGYTISTYKDDWVIASHIIEGTKPLFITAHVDTVRPDQHKIKLGLDRSRWCFQADKPGIIGADDRGGCLVIMELLATMKDKSVIFALFNYEESGGGYGMHGSSLFADSLDEHLLYGAKLFIGLDRHGFDEYVTYDYDNSEIDAYLQHYGYTKNYGSFSDVSYLSQATRTACINISAGFTDEHSIRENGWLYPIFRAIETIPLLYNVLEEKVYPAEGYAGYDEGLGYEEGAIEFIEDLSMYGTASFQGYELTFEDVYGIVGEYFDSHAPATHRRKPTRQQEQRIRETVESIYPFTTMLPF